ncbi:MAG: general secretion pathway protein GspK [Curvibacter sp.]|nr:MAG: general secretion pathway protein GspK [Curvibacter sp.]
MRRWPQLQPDARKQHGAAILTALLLMALVATLSTAALWQQARAYDLEAAERARVQANWILHGTTDWARLILREDARSGAVDHPGEPWAITLQEAKLSTFLANGAVGDEPLASDALQNAYLSGNITDLQSRLNVTNLMLDQQTHGPTLRAFGRLFDALQIPQAELQLLVTNLRAGLEPPEGSAAATNNTRNATTAAARPTNGIPLIPRSLDQLRWLGLSTRSVLLLRPYVVVLPDRTTVNLNTAPLLVLQAITQGLDAGNAQKLIDTRAKNPFRSVADAASAIGQAESTFSENLHSVNSRFFEVRVRLRMGTLTTQERTVVQREGLLVKPLWKEREAPLNASVQ